MTGQQFVVVIVTLIVAGVFMLLWKRRDAGLSS